ncbi:transcriptional regulator [Vibrio sp. SM6]|uniref:Transcriptional regulator n=1 Tax=Vibrio agarilyticus TaxID=2726741 RepID=A0A7X8TPN6_9VIBR|nr:transcriptional regulator [Vibrio agarilyticus]NLS11923.1 transcriptional regulator [Vibrio agarilyticus]
MTPSLDSWQQKLNTWYQSRNDDQVHSDDQDTILIELIAQTPQAVWGPTLSDAQSQAIATWLDASLRQFEHVRERKPIQAYHRLQAIYADLAHTAKTLDCDIHIRDWCMRRLQHITVLMLTFCQQQMGSIWALRVKQLREAHVALMEQLEWNESHEFRHASTRRH